MIFAALLWFMYLTSSHGCQAGNQEDTKNLPAHMKQELRTYGKKYMKHASLQCSTSHSQEVMSLVYSNTHTHTDTYSFKSVHVVTVQTVSADSEGDTEDAFRDHSTMTVHFSYYTKQAHFPDEHRSLMCIRSTACMCALIGLNNNQPVQQLYAKPNCHVHDCERP